MTELRASSEHDHRPALVAEGRTWTHAELHDEAAQGAALLGSGDPNLVFLFCRNTPGTAIAFLAARAAGHAVALLDADLAAPLRQSLQDTYRPEWVIEPGNDGPLGGSTVTRPPSNNRHGGPLHPDLAVLLSTSGSTGSPKLVRLSARAVAANARSIAQALELTPEERPISSLPLHYSYGLSVLDSHLVAGGCLVLTTQSPVQRAFWQEFETNRCTSYAGVPYGYQLLLRVGIEKMALPTLRHMTQAGGKLAPELVRRLHDWIDRRGGQFWVMYGQTEATARIAVLPADRLPEKPGAAGKAIPGGELLIQAAGAASATTTPGVEGEVVYRGPNVMMGYALERADLARGDEQGGLLRTGDLGMLDPEGFLTITGRSRRIGKVYGLRVNLDEVEALLRPHGPSAVVAGEDALFIYCEWQDDDWAARARELAETLRIHHGAFRFHHVAALPLTANGKIDYQRLSGGGTR